LVKDTVVVTVKGARNYWRYTLRLWIEEVKDIIEGECGVLIDVDTEESNDEVPKVLVDGIEVLEGVPGEEGYLIEVLKESLRFLGMCRSREFT